MKLYSFSKKSWHVKFFKWLFNDDPTYRYKTMCPYFWTYVLIFLFIIPILIVKMFGKAGTSFLSWIKDYKDNMEMKYMKKFIAKCNNPNLTPNEAYNIIKSKCWNKYEYYLDSRVWNRIGELYWKERNRIQNINDEQASKRYASQQKYNRKFDEITNKLKDYKDSKFFTYVSYVIVVALGLFLLYFFYLLISMIPFERVNWLKIGYIILLVIGILVTLFVIIGVVYIMYNYILKPFITWVSCIGLRNCSMCKWFWSWMRYGIYIIKPIWLLCLGIFKMFMIISHMIYSTYKKQCPIIKWED